jgi:SAM-dependent methyltransferase
VSFAVPADSYDRFMGRYSSVLAPIFADFAGVASQNRVLDVGCGPGALTNVLVERLGADAVTAVDPSESFVAAIRERFPQVEVWLGSAEALPFEANFFDGCLAQLVVHHMADPIAGIGEMQRVTAPGGVVAACVWDHGARRSPLGTFWTALREFDPQAAAEEDYFGAREGELVAAFEAGGMVDVHGEGLSFEYPHGGFDDWWAPFSLGVGPVGKMIDGLTADDRERLRELCKEAFPTSETLSLRVWAARAAVVDQTM